MEKNEAKRGVDTVASGAKVLSQPGAAMIRLLNAAQFKQVRGARSGPRGKLRPKTTHSVPGRCARRWPDASRSRPSARGRRSAQTNTGQHRTGGRYAGGHAVRHIARRWLDADGHAGTGVIRRTAVSALWPVHRQGARCFPQPRCDRRTGAGGRKPGQNRRAAVSHSRFARCR